MSRRRRARGWSALVVVLGAFALVACSGDDGRSSGATDRSSTTTSTAPSTTSPTGSLLAAVCDGTAAITDAGTIASDQITEASGLAASRRSPGLWWITNDSGDSARVFVIDGEGGVRATVALDGAEARDWEDLAIGPPVDGDGAATVYVGDIGDNSVISDPGGGRGDVRINRFTEPDLEAAASADPGGGGVQLRVDVDTFTLTYPDGGHDAEALLVDPDTGDLFVVTKDWARTGASNVYRAPGDVADGSSAELELVGSVPVSPGTLITAGDVSPDGSVVALRSYGDVRLYRRPAGADLVAAFSEEPCSGPPPRELQGESLAFAADGAAYVTVAEGEHPTLHRTSTP